jgi:hypothetical protein
MINFLIQAAFFGFGFTSLILMMAHWLSAPEIKPEISRVDSSATLAIRITGIAYSIGWLAQIFLFQFSGEDAGRLSERMTGPYWFAYWMYPVIFITGSQIFWIKRVRHSIIPKLIISVVFMLLVSMERLIIITTSMHRDFSTEDAGNVNWLWTGFILHALEQVVLFLILTALTHWIRNRFFKYEIESA